MQICRNLYYNCEDMFERLEELNKSLAGHASVTTPREIVFMALLDEEPMTMTELIEICAEQAVHPASVYRTVALFERLGIVQKLQIGWKYKLELSDEFHRHHHHLTCLKCGKTIPFDADSDLEKSLKAIAGDKKFKIQGHQLEIQGLCQKCRKS